MPVTYKNEAGSLVFLDDKVIHSGGEGVIRKTEGRTPCCAAKLYHRAKILVYLKDKISFMVKNSPLVNASYDLRDVIIWPQEMVFENGRFVGFIMPMVSAGIKLFSIINYVTQSGNTYHQDWDKFDPQRPNALEIRFKICYNLAKAIGLLHDTGKYVLVDIKPENILIKTTGHCSIIDLDSIQITQNNLLLFKASAQTPETAPPEFHQKRIDPSHDVIMPTWDFFSYAVVIYQVLLGIHPFQASAKDSSISTLAMSIENGLFVHGRFKGRLHKIPDRHDQFKKLPNSIQHLFMRALDKGHKDPKNRPDLSEWAEVLLQEIRAIEQLRNVKPPKSAVSANVNSKQALYWPAAPTHKSPGIEKYIKIIIIVAVLVILSLFMLVVRGKKIASGDGDFETPVVTTASLIGDYQGTITLNEKSGPLSYLRIKWLPPDTCKLLMLLKYSIFQESIEREVVYDPVRSMITVPGFGELRVVRDEFGKVRLIGNNKQGISWQFEK